MRNVTRALRVIQNLVSTRTWILDIICEDMDACNEFIKNSQSLKTLYDAFISVGCGILMIYFLSALINRTMNDELSIEFILREICKTLIGILFIKNGYALFVGISDFGVAIVDGLYTKSTYEFIEMSTSVRYSFWNTVFSFTMLIPNLIYFLIATCVSKVIIWGRMAELGLYISIAPIAISDLVVSGTSSNAYKYIKKVLALSLQGGVIVTSVLICQRFSEMLTDITNLSFGNFASSILIGVIMLKMLISSKSISEDIVGIK